jgi:hypothetical protein
MEFEIAGIDSRANKYEVTKAIAAVLHSEEFFTSPDDSRPRPMNFQVTLEEPTVLGPLHNGRGKLCIPTKRDGQLFSKWTRLPKNKIRFGPCAPFMLAEIYAHVTEGSTQELEVLSRRQPAETGRRNSPESPVRRPRYRTRA